MIDSKEEAAIGDKAAKELLASEKTYIIGGGRAGKSNFFSNIQKTLVTQQQEIERLQASNAELLEALQDYLAQTWGLLDSSHAAVVVKVRTAIFKATGEHP